MIASGIKFIHITRGDMRCLNVLMSYVFTSARSMLIYFWNIFLKPFVTLLERSFVKDCDCGGLGVFFSVLLSVVEMLFEHSLAASPELVIVDDGQDIMTIGDLET